MNKNRLNIRCVFAVAICLAGMAMFSSCEKHETDNIDIVYAKNSKLKQISRVESVTTKETGVILTQYEYDEQGRISKVSIPMYDNGTMAGLVSYSNYIYNSAGLLEKIINNDYNIYKGFLNLKTYIYSYDNKGKKQKEVIKYPQFSQNRVDSTLYFYVNNRLIREDKYENGYFGSEDWSSLLIKYIKYEYDSKGKLVKETIYSGTDNKPYQFSLHSYQGGLNVKTEIFSVDNQKIREIRRYYDKNDNLIYVDYNELLKISSAVGYIAKYEYY